MVRFFGMWDRGLVNNRFGCFGLNFKFGISSNGTAVSLINDNIPGIAGTTIGRGYFLGK